MPSWLTFAWGGGDAQALTEFHMVMLTGSRLSCINRVSGALVQEVPLNARLGAGPGSQPLGLAADQMAGAVYLFTGVSLVVRVHT